MKSKTKKPEIILMEWISVDDAVPEENSTNLLYSTENNVLEIGTLYKGKFILSRMFGMCDFPQCTHWFPIIDPPTSNKQKKYDS